MAYINIECFFHKERIQHSNHKDSWERDQRQSKRKTKSHGEFSSDSSLFVSRVTFRPCGEAFTHKARWQTALWKRFLFLSVRWDDSSYAAEWRCIYISLTLIPPCTQDGWEEVFFAFLQAIRRDLKQAGFLLEIIFLPQSQTVKLFNGHPKHVVEVLWWQVPLKW